MAYLKTRAPFWKKEDTAEGPRWVEGRCRDQAAAQRWEDLATSTFQSLNIAILTVSDTRTLETDTSGQTLAD
ncbi:hypothetical protein ACV34Z_35930, partial [Pseudomonas aeruginosa]